MALTWRERVALLVAGGAAAAGAYRAFRRRSESLTQIQKQQQRLREQLTDEGRCISRQTQTLLWLYSQFDFPAPLPPVRGWAASPDLLALLVVLLRQHQPSTVVELGGGTSTIIVAKVLRELRVGRLLTLEALEPFTHQIRDNLALHKLDDVVQVTHAPLTRVNVEGQAWMWYDTTTLDGIDEIDFLVVDGPAQHNNPRRMARYPAMPLLYDKLAPGAVVVMDDTNREDERLIAERWADEFPDLQRTTTYPEYEKGAVIFIKQSSG
jgi:predicted O-methyltransferase YrrM